MSIIQNSMMQNRYHTKSCWRAQIESTGAFTHLKYIEDSIEQCPYLALFLRLHTSGGVHVIITFLPEDDSENKQIEGRTCRMDDPGSARKILFAEDLEVLDASENGFMSSGFTNWDAYLLECRSKHEVKNCSICSLTGFRCLFFCLSTSLSHTNIKIWLFRGKDSRVQGLGS